MKKYGPWILYNSNSWENEAVEIMLDESPSLPISKNKVSIYVPNAKDPNYIRTADQAKDVRMPTNIRPRKIAICVLAAQWVRLGRLLAKTQALPKEAEVLVVPILSPRGYEVKHAIMEARGAVINFFKNHNAEFAPIPYTTS